MIWIFAQAWRYRAEIVLAVQFLAALRKSAREAARDYIRRRAREKLKKQLVVVGFELALLVAAFLVNQELHTLGSRLLASTVLWGITLYNLFELFFSTIPELKAVHRQLKGKVGYALKYFLRVSLFTELMQLNIVFLALCVVLGISARTAVGAAFSYFQPWLELFSGR